MFLGVTPLNDLNCSFSGAENEPRDIHPLQGLPLYGEDATDYAGDPLRQGFGMVRKPVPFGRTMSFYIPAVAAPWKGAH